jgi:hypothetical protein
MPMGHTHAEAPVRRVLAPLAALADRLDLAVIAVMHLNKDDAKRLLQRVTGAAAFVNAARSVLAVVRDPEDPEGEQGSRRLILHVGSNWGRYAPTLAAHVESRLVDTDDGEGADVGYLVIDGESSATVDDVQRGPDDHGNDAQELVAKELANGPRPSIDVKTAVAKRLGCSHKTVERAAMRLRDRGELTAEKIGFPRPPRGRSRKRHRRWDKTYVRPLSLPRNLALQSRKRTPREDSATSPCDLHGPFRPKRQKRRLTTRTRSLLGGP